MFYYVQEHFMSCYKKGKKKYVPYNYKDRNLYLDQVKISRLEPPFGKCDNEYAKSFEEEYEYKYNVPVHEQKSSFYFNFDTVITK